MKIGNAEQININQIKNLDIDLFLFAGNHEKRAFSIYDELLSGNKIIKSYLLCYKEELELEERIDKSKATPVVVDDHTKIYSILDNELSTFKNSEFTIVVDYSCMTKSWYYSIIVFLSQKTHNIDKLNVYFTYTPSKYGNPHAPKPNKDITPLPGKYIVPTDKPKALIVCLGYEESKAQGIIDHLDPKESYIFYSKPVLDPRFVEKIEENNQNILKSKSPNKIITFPLNDLLNLERELTAVYFKLKDTYSIIIAPLGPKPFTFISMLLSIKYKDIDIWRVGSGSDINLYKREPLPVSNSIVCKVQFYQ